jgi:hypothetical protein
MTNFLTLFLGHHDADCVCLRHPALDVLLLPEAEGQRRSRHTFSCDDSAGGRRNGGFFDPGNEPRLTPNPKPEPRPTPNPKPNTQTGLLRTGRFFFQQDLTQNCFCRTVKVLSN